MTRDVGDARLDAPSMLVLVPMRWKPEGALLSVVLSRWFNSALGGRWLTAQQANDDLLDIADVQAKRLVVTRLHRNVTIREENAAPALEVISRFAATPKWLIYLPPTMSQTETSKAAACSSTRADGQPGARDLLFDRFRQGFAR